MYNDMYNTFNNVCLQYNYPISFKYGNKDYLRPNNEFRDSWVYGDTIQLNFNFKKSNFDDKNYLDDSTIKVTFYNFRMEPIYEQIYESHEILKKDSRKLSINIDCNTSKEIFLKGTYFFSIQFLKDDKVYTITPPINNIVTVL